MPDDSIPAALKESLVERLTITGLITYEDAPDWMDSRVAYLALANILQDEFSGELTTGGDYFGGDVVDSYFIYNEGNQRGLTYDEALSEFRSINKARGSR